MLLVAPDHLPAPLADRLGLAAIPTTTRPADATVIVLTGPLPNGLEGTELAAAVARGATAVVLGGIPDGADDELAGLSGVTRGVALPPSEVFCTIAAGHPFTVRLPDEEAVRGAFCELVPAGPDLTTLATVSVAFRHRPAVVVRPLGDGVVVTCGFDPGGVLRSSALSRLLRRAVARVDRRPVRASVGVAVVGYGPFGGMGELHGRAVEATDGLSFVAVVDPDDRRRKAAEDTFPGIAAYPTVDDLCRDDQVEVAIVATPPSSHADLARTLLAAGRHVVVEKPLCLTVAEADAIVAQAGDAGRLVTVHQNRRWDPDFATIRAAVDERRLGEVFNVATFVGGFEHPCREWHSERSISGGAIYDWGSHHLDWILLLLAGEDGALPRTVQAVGHKRVWLDVTNLDQVRVRLLWDDGREAEFFQSDIAGVRPPKFYVQGTTGTIVGHYRPVADDHLHVPHGYVPGHLHHAEAPAELMLLRYEGPAGLSQTRLPLAPAPVHPFHRNLADHLHLGEPLAVDAASVRRVIGVMEAAERSCAAGGATVRLAEVLGGVR